jgi:hypothetical protein
MLAKGKTPKVLIAAARREPVVNIPEGSEPQGSVTRLRKEPHGSAGGKPAFIHSGGTVAAAIPPRCPDEERGFPRRN